MIEHLFQIGLGNAVIALALAAVALVVELWARRPAVAHLLWLLVFVKLITPSLELIPLDSVSALLASAHPAATQLVQPQLAIDPGMALAGGNDLAATGGVNLAALWGQAQPWLAAIWALGGLFVLTSSLWRVYRFHILLRALAEDAPASVVSAAAGIADRMGLRQLPQISVVTATVSPLVWWTGGRPHVVIPEMLLSRLEPEQLRWVLAHELAHVRRGDHMVRWIEWLACVACWWNPLVWWARRHLRASEELCCDALVVSCLNPQPREYAYSLLTVIETLAQPAVRPPAVASGMSSGGFLERRLEVIISGSTKKTTGWVLAGVLVCALLVLPLGFAYSSNKTDDETCSTGTQKDKAAEEKELQEAVEAGDLTPEEAEVRLAELYGALAAREGDLDWAAESKKIKDALDAGEISPEEAEAKLKLLETRITVTLKSSELADLAKEIQAAVEDGKLSSEEAAAKLEELAKKVAFKQQAAELAAAQHALQAAVEDGKLTSQEADARLKELEEKVATKQKALELEQVQEALRQTVETGELTTKEAQAQLEALKGNLELVQSPVDMAALEKALQEAVTAGKLTAEKAEAIRADLEAQLASVQDTDLAAIEKELQEAVEAGKLTRAEAEAKLAELEKKLDEEKPDEENQKTSSGK